MERRDFLKTAALTGLAVTVPSALSMRTARAAEGDYTGLFYINIQCGGGFDPTSLCDPMGFLGSTPPASSDTEQMNHSYGNGEIITRGGIRHAPLFHAATAGVLTTSNGNLNGQNITSTVYAGAFADFFEKHASRLMVLNGVDCLTNDHMLGTRFNASGRRAEGTPAFAALFAGSVAEHAPLAFMDGGGYATTGGAVAATRSGSVDVLTRVSLPNTASGGTYRTAQTYDRITRYQQERLTRATLNKRLPRLANALSTLLTVRSGNSQLAKLSDLLNAEVAPGETLLESLRSMSSFQQQGRLALAAYRAGIAAALTISVPAGFDTHANHDQSQVNALRTLLFNWDFLYEEVLAQGIDPAKVLFHVTSDFGRTPGYNAGAGKDHWSVTSHLLMGGGIPGGRTVGATTQGDRSTAHRALPIDPVTLAPKALGDTSGVVLTPEHVHKALRRHTGISDLPKPAQEFPLDAVVPDLPLFA